MIRVVLHGQMVLSSYFYTDVDIRRHEFHWKYVGQGVKYG